jgi:hypothetical protein
MPLLAPNSTRKQTGIQVWLRPETQLRNACLRDVRPTMRCNRGLHFPGTLVIVIPACTNNTSFSASRSSSPKIIFLDCLILDTGRPPMPVFFLYCKAVGTAAYRLIVPPCFGSHLSPRGALRAQMARETYGREREKYGREMAE